MARTLLLWDIDGTLIDSGGAGERALKVSLKNEFGISDDLAWLDYFGRTDVWIARTILAHHGLSPSAETINRFLDGYVRAVGSEMKNPRARTLPGVVTILQRVARHGDVVQGLLTGNLERGARIKLTHFDLWHFFSFGAYADDSELRNDLGPHAVRRAGDHYKATFSTDRVFVIGDTPHDIECGKVIGAKTIAVATGRHGRAALEKHTPTATFDDLSDVDSFLGLISD